MDAKYIEIEVEDSGVGIDLEECQRLNSFLANDLTNMKTSEVNSFGIGLLISNQIA